jgi:nucleoside-triphosphatase
MTPAILLTGHPGCGKTTLVRRVVARVQGPVGGFYTQEIREGGVRQGFKMVTFDGQEGVLAHVNIQSARRIGRYGVDLDALDTVGVASLRRAVEQGGLVVIDEIGPMEIFSQAFRQAVIDALASDSLVFGTIVRRSKPFSDQIKARPDVRVIEVTPANRDDLLENILGLLRATGLKLE